MKQGKVYIIGAGPGNYHLLTLRAVECIKMADVIVHDRLIEPKVLTFASEHAKFINVGKHPTLHQVPQEEINQILRNLALEGRTVARVKGGDPFLFGRGGEECEYLRQYQIEYEVVPGVSSSIAVPAYAGIPVTHRDYASSVHIIAGHKCINNEEKGYDFDTLTKLEGTLVFLMGVKNIMEICSGLISYGKPVDTPVAIIEKGATADQRVITGTLGDITEISVQQEVTAPAVIVIGKVAELGDKLTWYRKGLLSGRRIIVTRPSDQSESLVKALEELGATVIELPVIKIVEAEDYKPLRNALEHLQQYSWLVFTSKNGVEMFFHQLKQLKIDLRILAGMKLAVVGTATERALNEQGIYVDYIPDKFTTADLCNGLITRVGPKDKLLLLRSEIANPELSEGLKQNGVAFDEVSVYKTIENHIDHTEINHQLDGKKIDFITFTSPSTVKAFATIIGEDKVKKLNSRMICIGPVTAKEAVKVGMQEVYIAEEHIEVGIVKKLIELSEDTDGT